MARFLYRVGRFAFRHRLAVIGLWVVLLIAAGALTLAAKPFVTDYSVPGTGSARAQQILDDKFPELRGSEDAATVRVVVHAPPGTTLDDPVNSARIDALVNELRGVDRLAAPERLLNPVAIPLLAHQVSADRTIAYLPLTWSAKFDDIDKSEIAAFRAVLAHSAANGLPAEATGTLYNGQRVDGAVAEGIGFGVALIVMIIAFASVVAAVLPIVTALFGIGVTVFLLTGATALFQMDAASILLATMIGIAVSIDYSLFIVSRYRDEMTRTDDPSLAAARAGGTAGTSVVFAGLTVFIALVGLRVVGNPMMTMLGFTAAAAVVVAVLAAITLLPALLGLLGRRAFALRIPGLHASDMSQDKPNNGSRWARWVLAHPIVSLLVPVAALAIIALPALRLEVGLDVANAEQRTAIAWLDEGFGPGLRGPLVVAVDAGSTAQPTAVYQELANDVAALPDVGMVAPPQVNADRTGALIYVVPASGPAEVPTRDLVHAIRALDPGTGTTAGVAGETAILVDLGDVIRTALLPYLALVVGMSFLVLMLVFRSLLVPLIATVGFMLSIAATFGITVAVFQLGWFGVIEHPKPLASIVPIYLIAIVFGLTQDYQIFLGTRMREVYVRGPQTHESARSAIVVGFQHGARVVCSAALVMISVFAAFMLLPDPTTRTMGFALSAAIIFDAFLVRLTIVPALMGLVGKHAWYLPAWLDRVLPKVDIEGLSLDDLPERSTDSTALQDEPSDVRVR